MTTPELLGYIRSELAKGVSREIIRSNLVHGGGWKEEDLQEAFAMVIPPPPPVVPTPIPPTPIQIPIEPQPQPMVQPEPVQPFDQFHPQHVVVPPVVHTVVEPVAPVAAPAFQQVQQPEPVAPALQPESPYVMPPIIEPVAQQPIMQPGFVHAAEPVVVATTTTPPPIVAIEPPIPLGKRIMNVIGIVVLQIVIASVIIVGYLIAKIKGASLAGLVLLAIIVLLAVVLFGGFILWYVHRKHKNATTYLIANILTIILFIVIIANYQEVLSQIASYFVLLTLKH